jgi:hypothetical protein
MEDELGTTIGRARHGSKASPRKISQGRNDLVQLKLVIKLLQRPTLLLPLWGWLTTRTSCTATILAILQCTLSHKQSNQDSWEDPEMSHSFL